MSINKKIFLISFMVFFLLSVIQVMAVPPTKEAIEKWKSEGVWEQKIANWKAFKAAGGDSPEAITPLNKKDGVKLALSEDVDTAYVIVILVDFSDLPYTSGPVAATPEDFDSLLFSNRDVDAIINPTGSMTDYYLENSYGKFYVKGDIFGWYRMPKTAAYYAGDDNGQTFGPELARCAVDSAEANGADFSKYDMNFDGYCDGVVVIHAGRGGEEGGTEIWSHKYTLDPPVDEYDDIIISAYTMNPEESSGDLSPIGVFCHEFGHVLGLPDLYDIDYEPETSDGLGDWTIMGSGSYNGEGKQPAHFDAWCKGELGFVDYIMVDANIYHAPIPRAESEPVVYRINSGVNIYEFWLVENRQRVGFDEFLPSSGLCIYHVDLAATPQNNDPYRYYVALEQADGNDDLAWTLYNQGDAGDTWPGYTNNRNFHDLSVPDSRTNSGTTTEVGVWDITDSDSLMYADLDMEYSRPYTILKGPDSVIFDDSQGGNNDGIINAGETINFYCTVQNLMRTAYNLRASMTSPNPDVEFTTSDVSFDAPLDATPHSNYSSGTPIVFEVADTLTPVIDTVFLTVYADSLEGVPGSDNYSETFGLEVSLGAPQVLIVDDDQGADGDVMFKDKIYQRLIPHEVWHTDVSGSPTGSELAKYPMVFWHTGGVDTLECITSDDITAMQEYLQNSNGNLFLSGFSAVFDIANLNPTFLSDYLHVTTDGEGTSYRHYGLFDDNTITAGTKYRYNSNDPTHLLALLEPVNGGLAALAFKDSPELISAVSYDGDYKTFLMSFPYEYVSDDFVDEAIERNRFDHSDTLLNRIMDFFGGLSTAVYDGSPFATLPNNFDLNQNYPNPFNPSTVISYTLRATGGYGTKPAETNLAIYNMLGQRVTTLVDEVQLPGTYTVTWDGRSSSGNRVASGVYFYKLTRGDDSETKKMVLLK